MKKAHVILPILASGVLALSVAAFAMMMPKAEAVKAESPWSIDDTSYEVAMLEHYGTSADQSSVDRPLGVKLLAKYLYDSGKSSYAQDTTLSFESAQSVAEERVNPSLEWRFNAFKPYFKNGVMRLVMRAGTSSINMYNTTQYDAENHPEEYAIARLLETEDATYAKYGSAMISNSVLTDINDISLYWRTSSARRLFVCYQLNGTGDWKRLCTFNMQDSGYIEGNIKGTRGWDTYGFTTFRLDGWATHELNGASAKLAFVISNHEYKDDGTDIHLSAININANKSAVRYLNSMSYREGHCTNGSLMDLHLTAANNSHSQDLYQLATENADGDFLANYDIFGNKTSETTALGLHNYLVSAISGLGEAKVSAANPYSPATNNGGLGVFIVVGASALVAACALSITTVVIIKKKFVR